ncbi:MAG: VWA domain-containing protein, partial [Ignavibacteriae bacterium]|nr:VWA domain-containing protein [Ignavibacteriota bacterium]
MPHQFTTESTFFNRMEEFGFFDAISDRLPEEFTLVFEIARILEDESKPLTQRLAPILWHKSSDTPPPLSPEHDIIPHLPAAEEYEASLIDSFRDIARIYPHQFLLPEEVFYQKLVERSLWLPKPRAPRNYRYQTESNDFAPDSRKQKVYLLFDTSKSMQEHYRIHLAKAIAFFFLRQNRKELGTVYFRTFDAEIGELKTASDIHGFEQLISDAMHLRALGRGTAMEKALLTAITDIRSASMMGEAEILVITDGAAHIDVEKLRPLLGDTIKINTVKIGTASITPDAKFLQGLILTGSSEEIKIVRDLQQKLRDLEHQIHNASSESRRGVLRSESSYIAKQINQQTERIGKKIAERYGREIEDISSTFIQITDLVPQDIFKLSEDKTEELKALTVEMLSTLINEPSLEDLKKAALLNDHLEMMTDHHGIESEELTKTAKELQQLLEKILKEGGDTSHQLLELSEK